MIAAPRRSAHTLAEVLIFAAVAAAPLAVIWNLLVTGTRQGGRVEAELARLQALELIGEQLRDDLSQAVRMPETGTVPGAVLAPGETSHELSFLKFRSYDFDSRPGELYSKASRGSQWVRAEHVRYWFDAPHGRLLRNGQDFSAAQLAGAGFSIRPAVPASATAAAGASAGGELLRVELSIPPAPGEEATPVTTVAFEIGLARKTAETVFASWNPNAFDGEPRVEP